MPTFSKSIQINFLIKLHYFDYFESVIKYSKKSNLFALFGNFYQVKKYLFEHLIIEFL